MNNKQMNTSQMNNKQMNNKQMNINTGFEMTEVERQHSALSTITNMLIGRRWISDDKINHLKTLIENGTNEIIDTTFILENNYKIAIKFYNAKLNTLKNDGEIDSFLAKYPEYHKIFIVNDIAPKAEKQIADSKNNEVFKIMEIIRDISKHHLVPKHILLTKEDAAKFMEEYKLKKKDMGRIYVDDPMARYLYAQKDDIIQIIRETITSGYSTYYRLVVPGSIYN
jgi:DNA-directed RNA polymerase subunit H (RpoH/RPB5)